jgi:hypothetical protein
VQVCIDHIARFEIDAQTKDQYKAMVDNLVDWIAPGSRKQDLSFLTKNRIGKVIKAHG